MRIPKIENYNNKNTYETKKINEISKLTRNVIIMNDKDKIKFIKGVEKVIRGSYEYKMYVQYLREEIDMSMCSFFNNVSNKDTRKISIEIHHEPFTLFDITQIVVEKWIAEGEDLNPILIAEEVMKVHYRGQIGLIPLSITVHELVHTGKLFIPLQNVYGDFISFLEEYDPYIPNDLKDMLEVKLKMSKELQFLDMTLLEKRYIYLDVDNMTFPQPLEEIIDI